MQQNEHLSAAELCHQSVREAPIIEYRRIGMLLRVAAIDPLSGTEVVIQGPATGDPAALRRLALRKLAWALDRAADRRARAG